MPDAEHVRPATGRPRTVRRAADLDLERSLLGPRCRSVAGMDEVGRGALAGPVAVGAAVVDAHTRLTIPDLTDSKLLSPARRTSMAEQIAAWEKAARRASIMRMRSARICGSQELRGPTNRPPSTIRCVPVTKAESSLARNSLPTDVRCSGARPPTARTTCMPER